MWWTCENVFVNVTFINFRTLFWFALFCLAILWIARKTNYCALAPGMKIKQELWNDKWSQNNKINIIHKRTNKRTHNRRHTTNTFGPQYVNRNFNRQTDKLIIKLFLHFVLFARNAGWLVVGTWYMLMIIIPNG